MKYENSIVVGTSNFALQCAEKLREYLPVSVIENKFLMFSSLTKKCQKIGISCIYADKNETMEILRKTTEKTIIISALNIYLFPKDIVEKDNLTIIKYGGYAVIFCARRKVQRFRRQVWHVKTEQKAAKPPGWNGSSGSRIPPSRPQAIRLINFFSKKLQGRGLARENMPAVCFRDKAVASSHSWPSG